MLAPKLALLEEMQDLREVWPHEALDFTPWLAQEENINLLGNAIGIDITVEETESSVGDFNVDIFGVEPITGKKIIIENQLEDTNHDHLGKLITYASGKSADLIIWVVKHAREEHRSAVEWLNAHTDEEVGFFLCEVKLYRIGDSAPAVKIEVVEKPNDWAKEIKRESSAGEYQQVCQQYWTAFCNFAYANSLFAKAFRKRNPSKDHWMEFGIGSSRCQIVLRQIRKRSEVDVELYINNDKAFFAELATHRQEIESTLGFKLDWRELPERKASRIVVSHDANFDDEAAWPKQFQWIMETAIALKKAFAPYL